MMYKFSISSNFREDIRKLTNHSPVMDSDTRGEKEEQLEDTY